MRKNLLFILVAGALLVSVASATAFFDEIASLTAELDIWEAAYDDNDFTDLIEQLEEPDDFDE